MIVKIVHNRRIVTITLMAIVALSVLPGCGKNSASTDGGADSEPLRVGIIPFDKVDALQAGFQPFATYLGSQSGRPGGKVFVTPSYVGILQALQSDQIDCAYLNPLSYVIAVQQFRDTAQHPIPLAMPYFHGSLTYKGIVFVRADSGINKLQDLRGKTFAFADQSSTSGYLYPAGMLKAIGIDPEKDLKAVNISGNKGVLAVYNRQADAGATYETGLETAFTDTVTHKTDTAKVAEFKIIATTDPIPNGMFVARGDLDKPTLDRLTKALETINIDPLGQATLKSIPQGGWDKLVPADDHIFDSVRKKATLLHLNLQSLDAKK